MSELYNLQEWVEIELINRPETRNDDYLLVMNVWKHRYGVHESNSISQVMRHHNDLGLPGWDSIRRARQKAQAENPELRAKAEIDKARLDKQEEYVEYATAERS